jgi:hypothetical protein
MIRRRAVLVAALVVVLAGGAAFAQFRGGGGWGRMRRVPPRFPASEAVFDGRASDPRTLRCPFTMATDVGTAFFDEAEVENLRAYLLKGGFLWVDDFWGTRAWDVVGRDAQGAAADHQIVDVPADHPIRTVDVHREDAAAGDRASTSGGAAAAIRRNAAPTARWRTSA